MTGPERSATATTVADDRRERSVQTLRRPEFWHRDLAGCLQATFGTVLRHGGHDPLAVLGTGWEFRYLPGDVPGEEFYHPCRVPGDVGRSLAPHHPVRSLWHVGGDDPLSALAEVLADDELPIAAVDGFHLPFRPAFHDVHGARLVVVYGIDRIRGLVHVSDAMPPAFSGAVRCEDFLAAWGAANPVDGPGARSGDARTDLRYLTVELGDPFPVLDRDRLGVALRSNVAGFADVAANDGGWVGLAGVGRYVDALLAAAETGDPGPLRDAYTFGGGMQAVCGLHGELLRRQGARWDEPALREAGRRVEAVAHAWTGLRVTAAHGWPDPRAAAADVERHGRRLRGRYEVALTEVDLAGGRL